jgi:hypothetical protein
MSVTELAGFSPERGFTLMARIIRGKSAGNGTSVEWH